MVDYYTQRQRARVLRSQATDAEGLAYDHRRDTWMHAQGLRVLRFDNRQVLLETDAVLERLRAVLAEQRAAAAARIPPNPPSQAKGGT
ncbi:MAG: endonuclease domain-containing protein [Xanthomonadales bacterium]|nr:endonuclease domain-containing protein [Xanthomonadales bacterium]